MARIVLSKVSKVFGPGVVAVRDLSLEVGDGEFMVLVGPSGCGKTTVLRLIAGLDEVTAGEIYIGDRVVTDLPPKERDVAMVFQNYALYPHMTVEDNIGFGLRIRRLPRAERSRRVREAARILGLEGMLARRPSELSGGQRQRVAMGRAIVREPQAFLMDEPLSNLDAKLRVQMRAEIARLHARLGTTTIYVTHDQVEAMTLGQRVAVLREGVLQQVDTPQNLYRHPANLFVAAFIGSPPMNLAAARVSSGTVVFSGVELPAPPGIDLGPFEGRTIIIGIRPQDLLDGSSEGRHPMIEATAEVVEELGSEVDVIFSVDAPPVDPEGGLIGRDPDLGLDADRATFRARLDSRTGILPGRPLRVGLDPTRVHLFDPETGRAISGTGSNPAPA